MITNTVLEKTFTQRDGWKWMSATCAVLPPVTRFKRLLACERFLGTIRPSDEKKKSGDLSNQKQDCCDKRLVF